MKKIIILSALALASSLSIAQSTATGSMDISSNAISGCKVSGEDFDFGIIAYNGIRDSDKSINIHCSKGTQVEITQIGIHRGTVQNYNSGAMPNNITLNGNEDPSVYANDDFLRYTVMVETQPTNADYEITKYPTIGRLGTHASYTLVMNIKQGNEIVLPIKVRLSAPALTKKSGVYTDTITYTLSY